MTKSEPRIICLGNFDGVHIGHRALFMRALEERQSLTRTGTAPDAIPQCGVLTFGEPTYNYLRKDPPPRITTADERERLILEAGMQFVISLDFSLVRDMPPEVFVRDVLIGQYNCIMTVCGYNYRFGRGGAGDSDLLSRLMGGRAVTLEPVRIGDTVVSSTAIRSAVTNGEMEIANRMLGRPYQLESVVLHGHGVGAGLGFATVNQHFTPGYLVPAKGVYVSRCIVDGKAYSAVSNIGCRPTFSDGDEVLCETHIIGQNIDLYGRNICTQLYHRLRPERRFDSPAALAEAVRQDIDSAAHYFDSKY